MLTIQFIRKSRDAVLEGLKIKNFKQPELIDKLISKDDDRRSLQVKTNELQSELNQLSKDIGRLFKSGEAEKANKLKEQTTAIKNEVESLGKAFRECSLELNELLVQVPNIPHSSVPPGNSEADNKLVREGGTLPELDENAMPHWELGVKYKLIDFDLGVKITGAGFPVFRGLGARLQRALISWFLEENIKAGYEEILPPPDGQRRIRLRNRSVARQGRPDVSYYGG